MASDNESRRRRYAENPELRKKANARCRAYHEANKDEISAARREKYANDPEKRRKTCARAKRYWLRADPGSS
jgi:hypothetical protein